MKNDSRLDHFGIFIKNKDDIDKYLSHMKDNNVKIHKDKKIHRDNSISFYVEDPDGNILQILWHPTVKQWFLTYLILVNHLLSTLIIFIM